MQNYNVFLINLDTSVDRLKNARQQLTEFDIEFERLSAVYGPDLKLVELNKHYSSKLNAKEYHKQLNSGEIGCYLSHRKAWQAIVDQELDFAVILEDDFSLNENFKSLIPSLRSLKVEWDYIKLAEFPVKRKVVESFDLSPFQLVQYDKTPSRTGAQAVSFAGAKKLLAASEKFGRPVDIDLQHTWELGVKLFGLKPYPVNLQSQFESEIDKIARRNELKGKPWKKIINQLQFKLKNHLKSK